MRPDPAAPAPFVRVGIAGLGLIGGSIALRARRQWPSIRIAGVDDAAILDAARGRGIIDEGCAAVTDLVDCDLVVLAAPVPAILTLIEKARALPGIVTDVGSTKRRVMAAAAAAGIRAFVGGHPMAGAAEGGLDHAAANLFEARSWMLINGSATQAQMQRVQAFVIGLGARPGVVNADWHDRTVAYVSHLPQLLATSLMSVAGEAAGESGLGVAGPGFADMTRLAASSFSVWQGILETNGDLIAEAARALSSRLPQTAAGLIDGTAMSALFHQANAWHARARKPGER